MKRCSIYNKETGLFTGKRMSSTDSADIALNLPTGFDAIEGDHDHLSACVDLSSGNVIDYQPPQPSIDHEWNVDTKRWMLNAAALARQAAKEQTIVDIAALETQQLRSVRELALDPSNKVARQRLQDIDSQIAALRPKISES